MHLGITSTVNLGHLCGINLTLDDNIMHLFLHFIVLYDRVDLPRLQSSKKLAPSCHTQISGS